MKNRLLSFFAITIMIATTIQAQIITTVAGNGTAGYNGDGGKATAAQLNTPNGVAVDIYGNIYIADATNNEIRKVSTNGIISTIAGNGFAGYSGDGGSATAAQLNGPFGVAVDTLGNVYIADDFNHRIRKVNQSGIISTVAGNGFGSYSGDGGSAKDASIYFPTGVAIDGNGNLFIADRENNRIRKVSTNGIISTVAGNGRLGFVGDGGSATAASLKYPFGVAVDASGNIYIADWGNYVIRKVSTSGVISTIAGGGTISLANGDTATSVQLYSPEGVAVDIGGNVYIADGTGIRKVSTNKIITTVAGGGSSGDGDSATHATLNNATGIFLDELGNLYIADQNGNRIRKVTFGTTTPVTMVSFTAIAFNKIMKTEWQTALELNTSNFIIQHSTDGCSFSEIGSLKAVGAGANSYEFTDNNPSNGINYYRLQSVDKDGSSSFSKVVSVNYCDKQSFSITPNPAKDFAAISFSKTVDKAAIAVYDITGKAVIKQSLSGSANTYKLNTQSLKSGLYVIKINTTTGNYNEKLLINK